MRINSSAESPRRQRSFSPLSTADASLLPPPNPAPTGIFFIRRTATPVEVPAFFCIRAAARQARFLSSAGSEGSEQSR